MKQAEPIEAELIGSNECRARGITTRGSAPVLALCRALLGAGYDPSRPLHVLRGKVLALKVRSIGEGAELTVSDAHGRPRLRRMPPQDWARLQEGQGRGLVASPSLAPDADEPPMGEAATDESEAG
jgi:hypothetical protein